MAEQWRLHAMAAARAAQEGDFDREFAERQKMYGALREFRVRKLAESATPAERQRLIHVIEQLDDETAGAA